MKRRASYIASNNPRRPRNMPLGGIVYGAEQLARTIRQAYKYSAGTRTTTRRRKQNNSVATAQRDVKVQYVARRQSRRSRRRQAKKYRSWVSQQLKQLATKTVHLNDAITAQMSLPNVNSQVYAICHLYGNNGSSPAINECGARDVKQIKANDPAIAANSAKIYFDTACMDITMSNISLPAEGEPRASQIEVDVYDIVYRDDANFSNFVLMLTEGENRTSTIGSGSALQLVNRGATLFEFPEVMKFAKIKILKKTKIILPVNQDATFRINDRRNRTYGTNEIGVDGDKQGYVIRGATRSLLFVAKATVGDAQELSGDMKLRIGCTRTYKYKHLTQQVTQEALISG